ncbi:MAG: cupin domain-containing protein [Thaumarchaeota archaeon]|nr:cupin domain-containing protein [Nitrososphaerota archaeon]
MAERERERNRSYDVYQSNLDYKSKAREWRAKAAKLVKGKDFQPMWNGHGYTAYLVDPERPYPDGKYPATRQLHIFKELLPPGGSNIEHKHLDEAAVFILFGHGHSMIGGWKDDERATTVGERFDWEAGDIVLVPPNTWHVFFNDDKEKPAIFLGITSTVLKYLGIYDLEHHGNEGRKPWDERAHTGDFDKWWKEAQAKAMGMK